MTAAQPARRVPAVHDRHLGAVGLAACLAAFAIIVGAAFAGSAGTLAGGIRIAGIDVGGLTPQAAVSLLTARSARLASVPARFVAAGASFTIQPQELGVAPDWAAAVSAAQSDGNGVEILQGFRRLELELVGTDITPRVSSYAAAVDYEVGLLAARVDRPVEQARIVRRGLSFSLAPGHDGLALDRARAASIIVSALASLRRGGPVALPVVVERPTLTPGQLVGGAPPPGSPSRPRSRWSRAGRGSRSARPSLLRC